MSTSVPPRFCADYSKRVSKCQKCKMQLEKGILRVGKIVPNFFLAAKDPSKPPPDMKQYFHKNCLFEMLFKARPTTKVIDDTEEIEGFEDLNAEDQDEIKKLVDELTEKRSKDGPAEPKTPKKTPAKKKNEEKEEVETTSTPSRKRKNEESVKSSKRPTTFDEESEFNSFYKFVKFCSVLKEMSDNSEKSSAMSSLLQKKDFNGELTIWLRFLLPETDKRNYKVTDELLVKSFAKILDMDEAKIQKYVTKSGDVALAIAHAHDKSVKNKKSEWSLQKVDRYLEKLVGLDDEDAILNHLKFAAKRFRNDELELLIRIIRKEMDTGADAKTIMKGIHPKAPKMLESYGLEKVVNAFYDNGFEETSQKSQPKKKIEEPKAKKAKGRRQESSDEEEESEGEMSESESEGDQDSDGSGSDGEEEEISGSDSDEVSEISSDEDDSELKENSPKKAARGTRTRPRRNDGSVIQKEECPPDMEACRYGEKCYRKNEDHLERFWHPAR